MTPAITPRKILLAAVAAFVLGATLISTVQPAWATHRFTASCGPATPGIGISNFSRMDVYEYVLIAAGEGYQWGGGCWNNNNRDDQPGDPPRTASTHGEGGDCSGLVFKAWRELTNTSSTSNNYWAIGANVHGPYTASSFKSGSGAPNVTTARNQVGFADAWASTTHIGIVQGTVSSGSDVIGEAKGEAEGTNEWLRTYRGSGTYAGAGRLGYG